MYNKLKNTPISLISTVAILLFLIIFINSAQNTLGRYMSSFGGQVGFSFNSKQSLELTHGEWEEVSGQQSLKITINNSRNFEGTYENSAVRIRLYIREIDSLSTVRINVDNEEYTANISTVPSGTAVYRLYGKGNICRFYGTDGNEVYFDLPNTNFDSLTATLTLITDTTIDTTGIEIIAETINIQGKGGN